ncbi:hypothetical protein [Nocardioides massiliensis]|uniref:Secreted protein n=1 Tax=Nocardioides massiliensis TaxID=1325935 RepID=A0ABT9NSH5_9ACTN|nr:hypothetical protein [Nocardioides massiliensis]MDP9823372.1 hypothetical protein [Nocardioides massiliensis]
MHRSVLALVGVLAATLAATLTGTLAAAQTATLVGTDLPPGWEPRPRTIVAITGDPANGFSITRYDGSEEHTTTWSETVAECAEYDRRVARVRCRAENRGRYQALRGTVSALRHYQWHAAGGADR